MQEQENKDTPMVDIDTSGPSAEVELKDEAQTEEQVEAKEQDTTSPEPQEASSEEQGEDDQKESKDKELENYSKDVQRRIAKLTGKWREAQRQRDEAIEFARLQKQNAEEVSKKYSSLETSSMKDRQSKIQSLLDAQKSKLAQAREAGDVNAEVDIQKEISRLGYEEVRLQELSQIAEEQKAVKQETTIPTYQPQQQPTKEVDPKAESWASNNRWFGTDRAMTYTAFDLHKTLVDEEGYDPKSNEYYAEIDKRMRVEFPHKFDTNNDTNIKGESTKPAQRVASATRSVKQSRKTISLTPSEVAIAKKLGVSLEDYAKQKKHMKEV